MIPAAPAPLQHPAPRRWQAAWREAVRDPRELLAMLGLESLAVGWSEAAARQFPLRVPRGFVARNASRLIWTAVRFKNRSALKAEARLARAA